MKRTRVRVMNYMAQKRSINPNEKSAVRKYRQSASANQEKVTTVRPFCVPPKFIDPREGRRDGESHDEKNRGI